MLEDCWNLFHRRNSNSDISQPPALASSHPGCLLLFVRIQLSQDMATKRDPAFANVINYLRYNVPPWLLQKPDGLWVLSSRWGGCLAPGMPPSGLVTFVPRLDEARTVPDLRIPQPLTP